MEIEDKSNRLPGKYGNYDNGRRKVKTNASQYRKGPIPLVDLQQGQGDSTIEIQLDSELDDNADSETKLGIGKSLPGSRGLLTYFARLSYDPDSTVDLYFVDTLIRAGADINFTDRYGQTMLHAIAREWSVDVATFFIERGADVNYPDCYGRTPLHVAAAYDYAKMAEYLFDSGANIEAKTKGECQTPVHYAAKKNSFNTLKTLIKLGGDINARDYKRRTPLFVAAELGRNDTAKFLLDIGAPAGVYDTGGNSAVAVMIEKMPDNAKVALDQFMIVDRALRKSYFYLNYMEQDRMKQKIVGKALAKTPLELIVFYQELEIVSNPVVQKLMQIKWKLFGFKYTLINCLVNFLYTIMWTVLGFTLPRNGGFYSNLNDSIWSIVIETLIVLMTLYFTVQLFVTMNKSQALYAQWKDWKIREIEKDIQYCHPRYPDERRFLMNETNRLRGHRGGFFQNFWNVFELIFLILVMVIISTRGAYVYLYFRDPKNTSMSALLEGHKICYALTLLVIWLRMMKVFQGFEFLAAFITLLGHVAADTMKFACLFFEFFIPFVCTFWMMFGGPENAVIIAKAGDNKNMLSSISQTAMTVWSMTFVGDFPFQGMVAINEYLAQILTSAYWALVSLVCLNLYIALMSETFSRVYSNAQANADLQQASLLISFESNLSNKEKKELRRYINRSCGPLEEFTADQGSGMDGDAVTGMIEELQKDVDKIQSRFEETAFEAETRNEQLDNNLKALSDTLAVMSKKLTIVSKQQNEILFASGRSGLKGIFAQGGAAFGSLRGRFSKMVNKKGSTGEFETQSDIETINGDDDVGKESKGAKLPRTQSTPDFSKMS